MDNYTGRFGEALRRLTSLQAKQGTFAPQQMGGADTAAQGGFGAPAPAMASPTQAPQMGGFAAPPSIETPETPAPQSADTQGGFSGGSAQVPGMMDESGAMGGQQAGTSWGDLVSTMPKEAKDKIADQIEERAGGNLKDAYATAAQQNGDKVKKNASRHHMALYLSEIALRFAANRGSSESNGEALAKATLQTDARYAGIREVDAEQARKDAETRRLEGRADSKEERVYTRGRTDSTADHTRDRGEKIEDDKRDHEQALELERLRAKREELLRKGQDSRIVVDNDGNYQLITGDGQVVTPTKEVTEVTPARGSRGKGTTPAKTTTKKVPIKALPKVGAGGLDQDTVIRQTAAAVKEIKADGKTMRELRRKYANDVDKIEAAVTTMARARVQGDVESLGGGSSTPGEINFSDLK